MCGDEIGEDETLIAEGGSMAEEKGGGEMLLGLCVVFFQEKGQSEVVFEGYHVRGGERGEGRHVG